MIQHRDEEDELMDCLCVCACVFLGVLMHTWQSEAILGFFPSSKKRLVKLLVFSPELLWGQAALNFFVHIIMIFAGPHSASHARILPCKLSGVLVCN